MLPILSCQIAILYSLSETRQFWNLFLPCREGYGQTRILERSGWLCGEALETMHTFLPALSLPCQALLGPLPIDKANVALSGLCAYQLELNLHTKYPHY